MDVIKRCLSAAGLDADKVVREVIFAYETEQVDKFPGEVKSVERHIETCPGGAVRSATSAGQKEGRFEPRYDLMMMNHHAVRRWAESYGEGQAKGYPEDNWMKGIPESNCLKHLVGHITMHLARDKSEDHLGHAMFNIATLIWMQEERPDMMDRTGANK